ncbi:MAG: GIY-YIG nuclease family protein [Lacunisphaera sp.]|nr:GIY-YIG nuclease family protein [Lacunisphaera sp.]
MSSIARWSAYEFDVFAPDTAWNCVSGVYIFAGLDGGGWVPHYIGQTENLQASLANHECWAEACREGATDIHVLVMPDTARREAIEQELCRAHQPRLNAHPV